MEYSNFFPFERQLSFAQIEHHMQRVKAQRRMLMHAYLVVTARADFTRQLVIKAHSNVNILMQKKRHQKETHKNDERFRRNKAEILRDFSEQKKFHHTDKFQTNVYNEVASLLQSY